MVNFVKTKYINKVSGLWFLHINNVNICRFYVELALNGDLRCKWVYLNGDLRYTMLREVILYG